MNDDVIILPSEEEREQAKREFKELMHWSRTLSQAQIDFLCNSGYYNNTMRGYLIAAAQNAGFTPEQTKELLCGLSWALSDKDKAEADQISSNY